MGIRITPRGFGKDWRYPITSAWSDWNDLPGRRRPPPIVIAAARPVRRH